MSAHQARRFAFCVILGGFAFAIFLSAGLPTSLAGKKPAGKPIPVKAEDITKEFLLTKDAAQKKYEGKTLLIEGTVHLSDVGIIDKERRISVKGYKDENSALTKVVVCTFPKENKFFDAATKLAIGQQVKIQASFQSAFEGNVFTNMCQLIGVGKAPPAK
jgi:tRNA_anti-like